MAVRLGCSEVRAFLLPAGRPRIDWKRIADLPVDSHDDAVEKLRWYAMCWKIEVFHKILKSGCRAEQARLRTAERLVRLFAVFCILSWRVFWLTMLNRTEPDLEPALVLTLDEIALRARGHHPDALSLQLAVADDPDGLAAPEGICPAWGEANSCYDPASSRCYVGARNRPDFLAQLYQKREKGSIMSDS